MAERSTAAVGVTHSGGAHEPPPAGKAGEVTDDGGTEGRSGQDTCAPTDDVSTPERPSTPELHSGHKIARRYRLEECVTRLDGFSSWRAVDEKLRRAVGVHLLPPGHPRARRVLAAARSAALLGDPRFVQVLDAVEDGDLVYVVHEWLPDSTPLSELLVGGPLPAHEAYQMVTQLAQALAAAHREGLSHLRLSPASVLRTGSGQYRIRGLAVSAALRGVTSDHPQRTDTEAIGALLYASLTQRWPYEDGAYGLTGVGALAKGTLVAPDQVRAGVHRGLSELAMRALVNDGATASREEQPCATPEELAKAVSALPRIRPPEQHFAAPPAYRRTTHQRGPYAAAAAGAGAADGGIGGGRAAHGQATPPALPGRTGTALKWGVSALLIAALGLGSWQVSEALMNRNTSTDNNPTQPEEGPEARPGGTPIEIADVTSFDPQGNGTENPETAQRAFDGDSQSFWYTQNYYDPLHMLKPGVGLILDLGKRQQVDSVKVHFEGRTSAELLLAPESTVGMPTSYDSFQRVTGTTGPELSYVADEPVTTQYVLVWLTELPQATDGNYRGRITEIQVSG